MLASVEDHLRIWDSSRLLTGPWLETAGFSPSMSQRFVSALGLGSKRAETATVIFLCAVKNHGEPSLFKDLHWRGGGQWVIGSAAGVQCSTSESQLENSVCDFSDLTVLEAACGRVASRNFLFELIMKKGTESPSATLSSEVVLLFIGETWRDNDQFAFGRGG